MGTKKGLNVITADALYFPVKLTNNPRNTNREYSKVVTGVINGEEVDLNYCSPQYELVPNSEIFPKIEDIFDKNGIEYNVNYSHINHVRFYATYRITDSRFVHTMNGASGDKIEPMLTVQHSYNGITKYKILFGYYRLVCSNGLTIPVKEMEEYNLSITGKHTSSIKLSLSKLDEKLHYFSSEGMGEITNVIVKRYEDLGGKWINKPEERIIEVLEATKINAIDNNKFNTINHIMGIIEKESNMNGLGYNSKVNDWLIYNSINAYLNDNTLNISAPENRRVKDSKVLEYMLETV